MKWIGQHIYDLVSKFRSEDNIVTIDPGSIKPLTIFQPVNDASPRIDMGSSDSERFSIRSFYASGTQTLQTVFFSTDTESATANYGAFRFNVDDVNILDIDDGGIDLDANKGISINGTDILTDSSGTATLSNIDALDATTIATIETAVEANIDSLTGPITLTQGSTGGGSAFKIDNDDVDQAALEIDAANTTAHAVSIGAAAVTTRSGIFMNCDSLTTGSAIDLDIDDATTTNNTRSLVKVDYDKAGVVAAEQTIATTGLDINMADAATNHADGIVTMVGAQIDVDSANAQGTITQKGLVLNVAADGVADTATTSGIEMEVVNGGTDIKMMSHANTSDYCTIATTTNGATTITTVDADAASANFEVAADGDITLDAEGDIKLEPKSGGSILLDGTIDVDAGVVTGATSITSTAFVGDLTGDVTGNADTATTAGTVTTAAQPNIESIGTDGDTLAINSDLLNMVNTSTQAPNIALNCQANDATGPTLSLMNQRVSGGATQAGANNDVLGNIDFWGYNDAGTPESTNYIAIVGSIADATDGEEAAKLDLQVKAHGYIIPTTGLKLDGDTGVAQQVNVTIGNGAASVVTIPGNIDLAGDIDVDGTLETDALTIGGTNVVTGSLITTLGTISAGTWQGTAIATGYTKHLSYYEFMGFNNNTSEDIYQHASPMTDTKAPFEHDVDHNADITTAMVVGTYFKAGGQVVPRAGTITLINGWAHTNGTSAEHKIALVRLRPAEDDSDPVSPVSIGETTWTSLGNNKLKSLRIASLSVAVAAGDILMTMIYDDTGGRTVFFNLTVEIET